MEENETFNLQEVDDLILSTHGLIDNLHKAVKEINDVDLLIHETARYVSVDLTD